VSFHAASFSTDRLCSRFTFLLPSTIECTSTSSFNLISLPIPASNLSPKKGILWRIPYIQDTPDFLVGYVHLHQLVLGLPKGCKRLLVSSLQHFKVMVIDPTVWSRLTYHIGNFPSLPPNVGKFPRFAYSHAVLRI